MNSLEEFASAALAWLWQTSIAAAVLAGMVLVLQAVFGRWLAPRWTYALWLLVVVRLVLPVSPESRLSVSNLYAPRPAPALAAPGVAAPAINPRHVPEIPAAMPARLSVPVLLLAVWMLVALCYFVGNVIAYRRFIRWVSRGASDADPRIAAGLRSAQATLRFHRPVAALLNDAISIPAVAGITRPCILLPRAMIENWSDAELKLALLHELVHVRRRDNLLNWGLIFVQALHWFNPLVWLALRRFRAEREVFCDSIVMSHLAAEERRSYGATLIKVAENLIQSKISAAVVPILNRKHEIHRRIRMIARFKPTSRVMSVLALAGVLALACITFTGAAQKDKAGREAAPATPVPESASRQESLEALEKEVAVLEAQIERQEGRVEGYRHEFRIPSHIAAGDGNQPGPHTETLRKLEGLRIEAEADFQRLTILHDQLGGMARNDLRKVIQTAAPDQQLALLLDRSAEAEQKYASMSQLFSDDHPEVKSLRRMIEKITQQIDERLDGVLAGLTTRRASLEVQTKLLRAEIQEYVQRDLSEPAKYREYFNAKRQLENLYLVRDRLRLRLIEEKIDAALPGRVSKKATDSRLSIP